MATREHTLRQARIVMGTIAIILLGGIGASAMLSLWKWTIGLSIPFLVAAFWVIRFARMK